MALYYIVTKDRKSNDQYLFLNEIINRARNDQGATLLIPDLQRPYIWNPNQVVLLIDSLVRSWPFGTFLTWCSGKLRQMTRHVS
ncbi:MAG: hypothetical protein COY53_05390 [Elusimicrobia bacterium CG_4_10_14_0_8_um_filter_37_32]|nr:MAG: hypothetical protein COS17_02100 [Elusimicrobia bacterium CG02_land_8_20_14_3_00_37_13]PIZ13333.1 MAG: hypothetical protein COY53_05390 [Elusimicrobia bacterium CG_4_10_14_0_8_um_filter_37_32]